MINFKRLMINFLPETDTTDEGDCRQHLGCWGDVGADRAIPGVNRIPYSNPDDPEADQIGECHNFAKQKGWTVFAVQNLNECYTSADAEKTYQKHGKSTVCENGKGGFNAQDVYKILNLCPGECSFKYSEKNNGD